MIRILKTNCTYLLLLIVLIASCKNKYKEAAKDVIPDWIGKEIKFPASSSCAVLGDITPCKLTAPKPYKFLIYTDSTGCTSCKLRLDVWKDLIREADTAMRGKVDFMFYFYPKNQTVLHEIMKRENFKYEVHINPNDELNSLNNFSKDMEYQCFLLDKDNKVLSVGNPTFHAKIWELDKKIINGELKP